MKRKVNPVLKRIIASAKKEYKAHPNRKWTTCVKDAAKKIKHKR